MLKQNEYWDKVAYDKVFQTPFNKDLFVEHVNTDKRVLDFGCGYGRTLGQLKDLGYTQLYGVDSSVKMIERAEHENPDIIYRIINDNKIPYPNDYFDGVLILAVLTSVVYKDDIDRMLGEIKRVLKPGGIIYINDFLLNTDKRNVDRYTKYENKHGIYGVFELEEGVTLRHFDESFIINLLSNLKEVYYERISYITMNGNTSNGFTYMGRK